MYEAFFAAQAAPYSIALAVVLGLFVLEIIALVLGGSLMAVGTDAPDVDIDMDADFDFDVTTDAAGDFDTDIDASPSGLFGWLGLKGVPFLIWLVSFLTIFGLAGLVVITVAKGITGLTLPLAATLPLAFAAAVFCTRFITSVVAAIMPKTESSAMSHRFLGGHKGVISQGTARRGSPAEAKIKDRHGNTHYLRVEPLDDTAEIAQGREVHVMRKRDGMFFVVDIT